MQAPQGLLFIVYISTQEQRHVTDDDQHGCQYEKHCFFKTTTPCHLLQSSAIHTHEFSSEGTTAPDLRLGPAWKRLFSRLNQFLDQILLLLLQSNHFILDGILSHQPYHLHNLLLSDAMGPVRRLLLHSRIPPQVIQDHRIGPGQVQPRSACLQRDEEHLLLLPR